MTLKTSNSRVSANEAPSLRSSFISKYLSISVPMILLSSLIMAYVLFFSAYSLQRHATFNTFAADLSYIDQPMWNTLHGRFMERTLDDRQAPRVAEHLEPILIPMALVFYLWDDVRALLIVQTIAIALGALPVYWIAKDQLQSQLLPLAFVLVYLMFPALQAANVADLHADPFVVAPFLFAFWYATQGRYRAMWGWALAAMLVKETLPTLTFMLGLYLVFSRGAGNQGSGIGESGNQESGNQESGIRKSGNHERLHRKWHGLALMAVSLAWFYVATFVIVAPLARQVYGSQGPIYFSSRYAGLSSLLGALDDPQRLSYLAGLLASVGWLALLAPEYLLLGLPVLAANLLSNFAGQYSGEQHYSAPLAPIFVIAAIYGARRLMNWLTRTANDERRDEIYPRPLRFTHYSLLVLVWLLAWSLGYHTLRGWTPLARDFDWPQRTAHHRLLARFAAQVPADAALSTTPPLHPHLAHRQKIYVFPTVADADFVLLDVAGRTDAHPNDVQTTFDTLVASGEFGVVDAADGYVLLSRQARMEGKGQALPDAFYDFARAGDAKPQIPARVDLQQLRLLGYDVVDDAKWRQTYVRFYWQALAPLPEDLRLWPVIYDEAGVVIEDTSQRPMVVPLWYPPARWKAGETVVTETLPWNLGPRFNVGLAVLRLAEGASPEMPPGAAFTRPEMRIPVMAAGPGVTLFHGETWAQVGTFAREGHQLVPVTERPPLVPIEVAFGEGIQLKGYRISNQQTRESGNQGFGKSSDLPIFRSSNLQSPISVVLEWEATRPIARDYTVFVHLIAPGGKLVSQSDAQPAWVVPWPTDRWRPDQPVLDGHRLALAPDLAPGRYQVQVGLYTWESLERLPVLDNSMRPVGDHIVLQEISIDF